jgi:transcriptional regulator with XRE-family HTH domain
MIAKIKKTKNNSVNNKVSLGSFIKSARIKSGYSQAELALSLGYLSPQFISDWEREVSSPPIKKLPKLAGLLNVKVDFIFDLLVKLSTAQLEETLNKEFKLLKKKK